MRYLDRYFDAAGHVVADPRLAARVDRDVYDDAGQLVRREWWYAEPKRQALRELRGRRGVELETTAALVHDLAEAVRAREQPATTDEDEPKRP